MHTWPTRRNERCVCVWTEACAAAPKSNIQTNNKNKEREVQSEWVFVLQARTLLNPSTSKSYNINWELIFSARSAARVEPSLSGCVGGLLAPHILGERHIIYYTTQHTPPPQRLKRLLLPTANFLSLYDEAIEFTQTIHKFGDFATEFCTLLIYKQFVFHRWEWMLCEE